VRTELDSFDLFCERRSTIRWLNNNKNSRGVPSFSRMGEAKGSFWNDSLEEVAVFVIERGEADVATALVGFIEKYGVEPSVAFKFQERGLFLGRIARERRIS